MPHPTAKCKLCKREFAYRVKTAADGRAPATCGAVGCRVETDWGADDWAGQARMAQARLDAGVPLNDVDRRALTRVQQP